jgi:hypothetical protein
MRGTQQATRPGSGSEDPTHRLAPWVGIGGVTLLALLLRLVHLLDLAQGPFGTPGYLPIDARDYHAWATEWLAGSWPPAQPYFRPPLYTWFVGSLYAVAGPDPFAVKLVQAVLGAATGLLIWATGRELFAGTAAPLLAAALWALCGTAIHFDAQLLPGSLDAFLQTGLVWLLLLAGRTQRLAAWAAAGVLIGLNALHRGGVLLLLPVLLVWLALLPGWRAAAGAPAPRRARAFARSALGLLVPAALVIAPVAWRNAAYDRPEDGRASAAETLRRLASGRFVAIAESSAVNFRLGNAPVLRELNDLTHPDHMAVWNRLIAEPFASGIRSVSEGNRFVLRATLHEIAQQPEAWLGLLGEKAWQLVNGAEIPRNTSLYPDREQSRVLRVLLWKHGLAFPSGLLLPFAFAGIWLLRGSAREHFVPFACLAVQALFLLAFFVTARYRLPSLPLLALYAAWAGLRLRALLRERRRGQALRLAGALALLLLISNHRVGAMPAARWPVEHYDLALVLLQRNELRAGEAQLRAALALDPGYPDANAQLCGVLVYAGRADEAVSICARAVSSRPDSADLRQQLGTALEAAGRRAQAIEEYRAALRLAPGHPKAALALARALEKQLTAGAAGR